MSQHGCSLNSLDLSRVAEKLFMVRGLQIKVTFFVGMGLSFVFYCEQGLL